MLKQLCIAGKARQVGAEDKRTLRILGTDESPDRMNTIIRADGWVLENFQRNPVVLWCHDAHSPPVGRVVAIQPTTMKRSFRGKDGKEEQRDVKGMAFDVEFATRETYPFADVIYRLFKDGFLRASSVGFENLKSRTIEDEDELRELGLKGGRGQVLLKNELVELSAVPVPANPNALVENLAEFAPAGMRSWFNEQEEQRKASNLEVDDLWLTNALTKIQKELKAATDLEPVKGDEERQDAQETSPDFFDGHVHEVANLDEDGNGATEEAGEPPHAHEIKDGMVVPEGGGEGDSKYLSHHPGVVEPAAVDGDEGEPPAEGEGAEEGASADGAGEERNVAEVLTQLDEALASLSDVRAFLEGLEGAAADGEEEPPPEGEEEPGIIATEGKGVKPKKKKKKKNPYQSSFAAKVLREIVEKAEKRFMGCLAHLAKRTELQGLELGLQQLTTEVRELRSGRGGGRAAPKPSGDLYKDVLESRSDVLSDIQKNLAKASGKEK